MVQRALERVLYIWALRHPASGYVQGINDLATPFFLVFLTPHLPRDRPPKPEDVAAVAPATLAEVEADTFWCLSKLIDSIQDHYTFAQPGIQRMVFKLKELTARIDGKLHAHLMEQNLHFIQFAFRWMNCLLMRELPIDLILRVWDTYLAEYGGSEDEAPRPFLCDRAPRRCEPTPSPPGRRTRSARASLCSTCMCAPRSSCGGPPSSRRWSSR